MLVYLLIWYIGIYVCILYIYNYIKILVVCIDEKLMYSIYYTIFMIYYIINQNNYFCTF